MTLKTGKREARNDLDAKMLAQSNATAPVNRERRTLIRQLAAGTAVLAGCSVMPAQWTRPLVAFGTLPAHAATSGDVDEDMHGYDNKLTIENKGEKVSVDRILQDKFVFPQDGPKYGKSFLVVWSDDNQLYVPDSKHMILRPAPDARKYQPGYPYSSNPDIPTMEVYAKRGTHPESVTLYY
jgi:hypothetical protein